MSESSFLYAGNLEEEIREISSLTEKMENIEQLDSHSVECASFLTIFCC